ncbi:four helix bundle protein [Candidatus Laterigemmans baculatus]|uniref:four helix bundle protein n=1 Tax=Candidatus Laterigemmans baculatus TaxID=2770505 RepID=UPI0013DA57C9|nr:four helix bundle protein [Candidatus Laterigemmans baculatus]
MPTDLPERTFVFAKRIVKLCQSLEQQRGVAQTLSRQLIRSGTSIGANIEEGQASQSRNDFRLKYNIACKETRETLYWLRLLAEAEIVPRDRLQPIMSECNELIAILTAIVKKLRD